MDPRTTIAAFDDFLATRGAGFTGIIIGGTALALLGIVIRPTRDCDVLDPPIPAELATHAREFAAHSNVQLAIRSLMAGSMPALQA